MEKNQKNVFLCEEDVDQNSHDALNVEIIMYVKEKSFNFGLKWNNP